jgi:hypothetical protein
MVYTEAKCLCGASRISWDTEPSFKVSLVPILAHSYLRLTSIFQFRCHCTDENHLAGNGFSNNYYVADPEETLKVLKPGFKHWTQTVLSGNEMTNHFCGECGSLVYRTSSGYPGFALKVGNVDVSAFPSDWNGWCLCLKID